MKRRSFLKGMVGLPIVAAVPSIATQIVKDKPATLSVDYAKDDSDYTTALGKAGHQMYAGDIVCITPEGNLVPYKSAYKEHRCSPIGIAIENSRPDGAVTISFGGIHELQNS